MHPRSRAAVGEACSSYVLALGRLLLLRGLLVLVRELLRALPTASASDQIPPYAFFFFFLGGGGLCLGSGARAQFSTIVLEQTEL
jgi:hypothetical protein